MSIKIILDQKDHHGGTTYISARSEGNNIAVEMSNWDVMEVYLTPTQAIELMSLLAKAINCDKEQE